MGDSPGYLSQIAPKMKAQHQNLLRGFFGAHIESLLAPPLKTHE